MNEIKEYSKNYQSNYEFEKIVVQYRRRKVLECLSKHKHNSVLEVGCGVDSLVHYMQDYENFTVVEPSKEFLKKNKDKLNNNKNIKFIEGTLEQVESKLKQDKFDFIIVSSLIHEIEDLENFLQTLARIANPETTIHVNVPNSKSLHRLLGLKMGLISDLREKSERNHMFSVKRNFDLDELKNLFLGNAFNVKSSGSYFLKPFSHNQMYSMLKNQIINTQVLDGLYVLTDELRQYGSEIYVNVQLNKE